VLQAFSLLRTLHSRLFHFCELCI